MLNVCNFTQNLNNIRKPLWLSGDDEFLKYDTSATYIKHCKKLGFQIKQIELKTADDWQVLNELMAHKSLFPEKKLFVCVVNQKSITKKVNDSFGDRIAKISDNIKIMLISNKLSANCKTTNIYKNTQAISIWPLKPGEIINWSQNQALFLGINISKSQLDSLVKMADYKPTEIKNYLEILSINNIKKLSDNDLYFCVQGTKDINIWEIIDLTMAGERKKLICRLNNIEESDVMPLFNASKYCIQNVLNILNCGTSLDLACKSVIKWPKQQLLYQNMLGRKQNWHKIADQIIQLEFALKGGKITIPTKLQIARILLQMVK